MEGNRRKPRRDNAHRVVCGVQDRSKKERMKIRERLALTSKVTEDEHFEIYAGLREEIVLHGPMNYAKTLKLRFRVGDLDLPEKMKRYTGSP